MANFDFCTYFDELPTAPLLEEGSATVLEDPGIIKVVHGFGRAALDTGDFIKLEQSADLPSYANLATVFLNGWRLAYRHDDHHVEGLGAFIRVKVGRGQVVWNAIGVIADDSHDEPYELTYHYTFIAWNDTRLDVRVVDRYDADEVCQTQQPGLNDKFFWNRNRDTTTALSVFPTFFSLPIFGGAAVLPRGFGFGWGSDHHLLQFAYNLDFTETLAQQQFYKKALGDLKPELGADLRFDGGWLTWNSYVIVKDDSRRRDYFFGELVSGVSGQDVHVIQPPFFILPLEGASGALGGAGVKTRNVVVDAIPYHYAIPMLTGWDIGYTADDQHVRDIGIWIDSFNYDYVPGSAAGRLRYQVSSILRDRNNWPDNYVRHKVSVLCLRHTPTRISQPGEP
jgi:hypothetical protein